MRHSDRIYRTFEEFEREELRRMDSMSTSVDDMIDTLFGDDAARDKKKGRSVWDDEDEE